MPYCIQGHTKLATRKGAGAEEIMEAIWVAAEMRAGGAYAHSTLALHAIAEERPRPHDMGRADHRAETGRATAVQSVRAISIGWWVSPRYSSASQ